MALATLQPTTRVVSILINAIEYNTVFDTVSVRSDAPEIVETVFSSENAGGTKTIGTEEMTLGFGGPLTTGSTASNPLLPLASFRGKTFSISMGQAASPTAQVISGTLNVVSSGPDLRAGGAARMSATARTTGSITVTWPST